MILIGDGCSEHNKGTHSPAFPTLIINLFLIH